MKPSVLWSFLFLLEVNAIAAGEFIQEGWWVLVFMFIGVLGIVGGILHTELRRVGLFNCRMCGFGKAYRRGYCLDCMHVRAQHPSNGR